MFGGIPSAPTPPNLSPLDSTPPQASLLSPYNDLRASSCSQSSLPGSSKTMRSATPTIPQPVQAEFPPRTKHESPHVNTTHHHRAQPESTGAASGGRRLGFWGRLLKPFRVSFHALLCIPKRPKIGVERLEPTPSSRHGSTGDATNGEDVRPQGTNLDSGGGGNAISSTQSNSNTHAPQPFGSLDAPEGPSPKGGRLPVPTSDGAHEEGAPTEANIGTPGQQPPADLDPPMPAAQPISSSPNLVPPPTNASAEPPSYAEALHTEPGGQEPDHNHPDVGHDIGAGDNTDSYKRRRNVSESNGGGYNGPSTRKTMSIRSFSTTSVSSTGSNSDDGQIDGQRGTRVPMEGIPEDS